MPTVASYCTTFLKPEMLHLYRQISGLKKWETFVITKERQSEELFPFPKDRIEIAPTVKSNFVRRFWLKHILGQPPIVYRGEYGALAKVLERRYADVLHVYFGHTGVHLLPFLKQWPKASVVSFHGMDIQTRGHDPSYEARLRELLQTTTLVLARSHSLQDRLLELGCPPEKLRMNRTGIPLDQFEYFEREMPSDGAWRFVQACRLIEKKGLDDAIHAFARFVVKYPRATFTIAGEGPLLPQLEALRDKLGLHQQITFTGFLKGNELCKLYDRSHIFIHPSRVTADGNQEGIPNSCWKRWPRACPSSPLSMAVSPRRCATALRGCSCRSGTLMLCMRRCSASRRRPSFGNP